MVWLASRLEVAPRRVVSSLRNCSRNQRSGQEQAVTQTSRLNYPKGQDAGSISGARGSTSEDRHDLGAHQAKTLKSWQDTESMLKTRKASLRLRKSVLDLEPVAQPED